MRKGFGIWVLAVMMSVVWGCGGGDSDSNGVPMNAPAFDLSGIWVASTSGECTGPEPYATVLEHPARWDVSLRIEQRGNHIDGEVHFPAVDVTESFTATVSGDQIHYEREDEVEGIAVTITGNATALSGTHVGLTERYDAVAQGQAYMVVCTVEYRRDRDLQGGT